MRASLSSLVVIAGFLASTATAQLGVQDQHSPAVTSGTDAAWFNLGVNTFSWQQQSVAGRTGVLEGIKFKTGGAANASFRLRIRLGSTWCTSPPVADLVVRKTLSGIEDVFVDLASFAIWLDQGQRFVIEITGNGSDIGCHGNYVAAGTGPLLYPHSLFFLGAQFLDNRWRIGFKTYMYTRPPCGADFNGDGGIDGDDIIAFIAAWQSGMLFSDLNHDGAVDGADISEFFSRWEDGSC